MSGIHAQARAQEAGRWLDAQPYPPTLRAGAELDEADLFRRQAVLDGYCAGADAAEADWTIERAVGQQQLDEAVGLMTGIAKVFKKYEETFRSEAAMLGKGAAGYRTRIGNAELMGLMVARIEGWLPKDAPCEHQRTVEHRTGDGTPVTFCTACGRAVEVGQTPEPTVAEDLITAYGIGPDMKPTGRCPVINEQEND